MNPPLAHPTRVGSRADAGAALSRLATQVRSVVRRFNQRNQRERLMLIAAAAALTWMAADRLWLGPALKDWQQARSQQTEVKESQARLQADIAQRQERSAVTLRARQAELAQWRARLKEADASLRSHEDSLVGADRMLDLLDRLLARHGEVRVRGLRSLGRSDLLNPAAPAATAASAAAMPAPVVGLYRHGVELVLEGSYADLLGYLKAMEALPQRVLWGGVDLQVEQHPRCVLTLRVYTLSRDPNWLEL